jgi:sensor histidine kinase YesM
MPQYRRNIFLIDKPFQIRFAIYVCSWLIALSFVYPLIVYSMFDYFIRYASHDPNGPPVQVLHDLRYQVMMLLIALQLLFLFISFLISIFMSHRIAGPLYKLKLFLAKLREGDLKEELHFREKDHFRELAGDYNEAIKSIRSRMDAAAAEIERALPDASPPSREALQKALTGLRGLQR